jgi:hypothetical protein
MNTIFSLSVKNINENAQELEGVSIYDRRYLASMKVSIN